MGSYISDNGLPYAVPSSRALPAGAYVGHTCLDEQTGKLMVKKATGYAVVGQAPVYATTSAFPSTHVKGALVFCDADKSLYLDNGTAYKKITAAT